MKQRPIDKCKLCCQVKELCDSHYLPKRLYAFGNAAQLKNPNPVMAVGGVLKQISDQYRGYVFCKDCEDLLNKNGEKWVLGNIPKAPGDAFPLQDAINQLKPFFRGEGLVLVNVSKTSALDVGQLVYFAASIFWRGAIHEWKTTASQVAPKVHLCAFEEPIRKFIHCESSIPDDVVITVDVWPYKGVLQASYPAYASHLPECQCYWFYIPGLLFKLYFGKNIPEGLRFRNAANGIIGVDTKAADSVVALTKKGLLASKMGSKMPALFQEIVAIRSKTPHKE